MATMQENDFVQVEYTGRFKEDNVVFDTTNENIAKKENLHNPQMKYGNVIVWIGQGQLLEGLEKALVGKELGKEFTVELSPENAFGRKDAKLLKIVSTNVFKKQNIDPVPGLQLNIDGGIGTIRTVTGGRTIVDFNHPFSGKDAVYTVKANKIITDVKEKISAYVKMQMNIKDVSVEDVSVESKEGNVEIQLQQELPKEVKEILQKKIKEISSQIKKVNITEKKSTTAQA